jgi:hypothetical protein
MPMAGTQDKSGSELFKGVLLVHLILGLHVVMIALVGLVVIFFGGIARYWGWILAGGLALAAGGATWFYRRVKTQGRDLAREVRSASVPQGGTLEVSFLGGLASLRLSRPAGELPQPGGGATALLEDPQTVRIRELASLGRMVEQNLITREEFETAKRAILSPSDRPAFGAGPTEH